MIFCRTNHFVPAKFLSFRDDLSLTNSTMAGAGFETTPTTVDQKSNTNVLSLSRSSAIVSVHGISSDQCCRTLDVTLLVEMQYIEHLIKIAKSRIVHEVYSREWFRSTDLLVMGPARFHCATLLMLSTRLRLLDDMLKCQRNMTGHSDSAFEIKSLLFLTRS